MRATATLLGIVSVSTVWLDPQTVQIVPGAPAATPLTALFVTF